MSKICNVCKIEKSLDAFYASMAKCKECYCNQIKAKRLESHQESSDLKNCRVCLKDKPRNQFELKKHACIECSQIPKNERRSLKRNMYKEKASDLLIVCKECNEEKVGTCFEYGRLVCKACDLKLFHEAEERHKQNTEDVKTCVGCNQTFPLKTFRLNENKCYECNKNKLYEWRKNNPDKFKAICERSRNKEDYREKQNTFNRDKYHSSLSYRIALAYRKKVKYALKKKINENEDSILEFLGCSMTYFMAWLEYNFREGMTWENHGSYWHIDHITPCASFDLSHDDQIRTCFHWKNHAPLEASENIAKHCKVNASIIAYYQERAKFFEENNPLSHDG